MECGQGILNVLCKPLRLLLPTKQPFDGRLAFQFLQLLDRARIDEAWIEYDGMRAADDPGALETRMEGIEEDVILSFDDDTGDADRDLRAFGQPLIAEGAGCLNVRVPLPGERSWDSDHRIRYVDSVGDCRWSRLVACK